jgi:predicted ArsR family transcriptional regulator
MTSLTTDDQMLLRGTFDDSLSVQDVADILDVERQTVRNRLNALVANWAELLEDFTEDEARMFMELLQEGVMNSTASGHDDG